MTYSVVARDPQTGIFGVAVQSHYFSVGAVVPWVQAGVGAVATQAFANITYGPLGIERMRAGQTADAALSALVAVDEGRGIRQVAMVDRAGRAAAHTGDNCVAHAGHRTGAGWSVQANMMRNPTVPDAMAEAFTGASGDLFDRLLDTLDAAEAEGGDIRGQQAAALVISPIATDGDAGAAAVTRLHVEDHERPLAELRRLVNMHRGYQELEAAQNLARSGDFEAALPTMERAYALAPASTEIRFWRASLLAMFGDPRAEAEVDAVLATNPDWGEFIARLVTAGVIPEIPELTALFANPQK